MPCTGTSHEYTRDWNGNTISESLESPIRRLLDPIANRLTIDRAHNLHITTIVITSRPGVWHDFKIKLSADDHEQKGTDRPKKPTEPKDCQPNGGAKNSKTGRRISSVCSTKEDRPQQQLVPLEGNSSSNRDT